MPRSRMRWAIPPLPNTPSRYGARLKHTDNFTFTFTFKLSHILVSVILFTDVITLFLPLDWRTEHRIA